MATVSIAGALALEDSAKAAGWTEERLLDLAGTNLANAIAAFFPHKGRIIGYLGKGHNAGDALVALKILRDHQGWEIALRGTTRRSEMAPLDRKKWDELGPIEMLVEAPVISTEDHPLVLLDGILGTGAKGPPRGISADLAKEMNLLRLNHGARTAAIDSPTGVDADCGEAHEGAVVADITFMIGNSKTGLLLGKAVDYTGALAIVEVPPLASSEPSAMELIAPQQMDFAKSPRPFDFHKGEAGRVAVLAGSPHYTGAAVLAATGALKGGAGLITLFIPEAAKIEVSAKCPPEIIIHAYQDPRELMDTRFDALVVGCGLGKLEDPDATWILEILSRVQSPTVIDADALNLIASRDALGILKEHHVITPHPGEFDRLAPELRALSREEACRRFSTTTPATLLLKGSRTLVSANGKPLFVNSTGSPAMATGGQGDLLAGVIGARLARGDHPMEAAALSAWVCGRAAEIALNHAATSEDSLTPSEVASHLGAAFNDWRASRR